MTQAAVIAKAMGEVGALTHSLRPVAHSSGLYFRPLNSLALPRTSSPTETIDLLTQHKRLVPTTSKGLKEFLQTKVCTIGRGQPANGSSS